MRKIAKVINTILRLKDQMSKPLKNVSKVTKQSSEQVKKAQAQVKKYSAQANKSTEVLKKSEAQVKNLTNSQNKNNKAIEKVMLKIKKYGDQTGLTSKQIENNNKKMKQAQNELKSLSKTQSKNAKALIEARDKTKKYTSILESNNKKISEARNKVKKYSSAISKNNRQLIKAQQVVKRWGTQTVKSIDSAISKTVKFGAAIGTAVAALTAKAGLSEAMDIEGYKVQLETAVKDTKKAGQLMADAVNFANNTPFETGSVVEATAKMEAYGISSKRWLEDVADMAGATNKSIDQSTEAMADATMGEFERLKEFGIKKDMIMAASAKKYGDNVVFNAKGQVLDQIKMQEILQETMQAKFKGGAEKLSKTTKGLWSTVTGITKSSLAKIVGMQEDGTIKQGSLYAKLQLQIKSVADTLLKWQQDGTITRIAEQVTKSVMKIINYMKALFDFVSKYKTVIKILLSFAGGIYAIVKAYQIYQTVATAVAIVQTVLNAVFWASPLGAIVVTIGLLVAAVFVLYGAVKAIIYVFKSMFNWIKNLLSGVSDFALILAGPIAPLLLLIKHFDRVKEAAGKAWNFVKKIFGAGDKNLNIKVNKEENSKIDFKGQKFAQGGIASKPSIFGEAGPEMAIPLNNSPRSKNLLDQANKSIGGNSGITINFYGDVYGLEDFKEQVCKVLVQAWEENKSNVVRG